MSGRIEDRIKEFVEISKQCPENLQSICFEILLKNYLDQANGVFADGERPDTSTEDEQGDMGVNDDKSLQRDITISDVHVKTKKFLESNGLTIDHINQIFYKEGEDIKELFDDLKTTKIAESQIRIALLQAFKRSLSEGDFVFNGEEVRKECELRKCYDGANFATNFRNNQSLFDGFDKYNNRKPLVKLGSEGKKELSAVIKDLQ